MGVEKKEKVIFVSKKGIYKIKSKSTDLLLTGNMEKVKTLVLNENIEYIRFDGSKLENIVFNDNLIKIGIGTFQNNQNLKSIILPENLTGILSNAFEYCTNLENIEFNKKIKLIDSCAFKNCNKLKSLKLDDTYIVDIEYYAFYGCESLKEIYFGNKLDTIGCNAFENCISLEEVVIPNSLRKIEDDAFKNCYNLKKVVFNSIPFYSASNQFSECPNIKEIFLNYNGNSKNIKIDDKYEFYNINFSALLHRIKIEFGNDFEKVELVYDMNLDCKKKYIIKQVDKTLINNNTIILPSEYNNVIFDTECNIEALDISNIIGKFEYIIHENANINKIILPSNFKDKSGKIIINSENVKSIEIADDILNCLDNNKCGFELKKNMYYIKNISFYKGYCILNIGDKENNLNFMINSEHEMFDIPTISIHNEDNLNKYINNFENNIYLKQLIKEKNIPSKYEKDIIDIIDKVYNKSKYTLIKKL